MTTRDPVKPVRHFDIIGWAYQQTDASQAYKHVLLVLAIAASEMGTSYPAVRTIMARTGCGERTVREAIAFWKSVGALTTEPRYINGTKKICANEYRLNPDRFPEEAVEDDTQPTPAAAAPLRSAHGTPAVAAPLIGVPSESPTSLRSVSRPKRREAEQAERGSWSDEMNPSDESKPPPAKRKRGPRPPTVAQEIANHFKDRCDEVVPAGGTQVGGLSKMFQRLMDAKVDKVMLIETVDMFFDGGYLQQGEGTRPPWLQYVNKVYDLGQILERKAKRARPRERSTTYGAMPLHIIEETSRGVRAE